MAKYRFTVKVAAHIDGGSACTILEGEDYPYMNIQIVSTPADIREKIIETLRRDHTVVVVDGHTDFVAIQAGGGKKPIDINQQNHKEVMAALMDCLSYAAAWWASPDKPEDILPQVHRLKIFGPDDPRSIYYPKKETKK
jgi:hypothetical protein